MRYYSSHQIVMLGLRTQTIALNRAQAVARDKGTGKASYFVRPRP